MGKTYTTEKIKEFPKEIYLDKRKDIKIVINRDEENNTTYEIITPNIKSKRLIKNLEKLIDGVEYDIESDSIKGLFLESLKDADKIIIPFNKFKNIELDLNAETISFPEIPSAEKVLMAQKENVYLPKANYLENEQGIKTDLHSHYTAMLEPEKLLALGLKHNVDYHLYYIYTLGLDTKANQKDIVNSIKKTIELQNKKQNKKDGNIELKTPEQIKKEAKEIFSKLEKNKGNVKQINKILPNYMKKMATIQFTELVLKDGGKENLQKIIDSCCLSRENQSTFSDMTSTYNFRYPFTNGNGNDFNENVVSEIQKSENISEDIKKIFDEMCEDRKNTDFEANNLQDDTLLWIAKNAQKEGIEYIEMSHNALSTKDNETFLECYDRNLDKLEKLTGVKLRFLAGVSRSAPEEKFPEIEENIKRALKSKYVVGFDVLGEEVNSTNKFAKLLDDMTQYALEEDPNMVIRVHAGESYSFKDNVFKTIEIVYKRYLEQVEKAVKNAENPLDIPKPNLRIGHGIYGLDEEMQEISDDSEMGHIITRLTELKILDNKDKEQMNLLDFMSQMDIVIERCLTSNILLSHQNALGKDPLRTYLKHNVKCVLGTDGYGVYSTSSQGEVVLATTSGIGSKSIQKIRESEQYVVARSLEREEERNNINKDNSKDVSQTEGQITEENNNKKTDNKTKQEAFPFTNIQEFSQDKNALVIVGGSYNTYDKDGEYVESQVTDEDIEIFEDILNVIDPQNDKLVIGGRLQGQELKLIELVNEKNKELQDHKIEIVIVVENNQKLNEQYEMLSSEQKDIIKNSEIQILQTFQKEHLANYKTINDEIFSQDICADLIVLDGGQAAANLMTDANKGEENHIYSKENINDFLKDKINALENVHLLSTQEIGKGTLSEQENTTEKTETVQQMYSTVRENRKSMEEYKGEEL